MNDYFEAITKDKLKDKDRTKFVQETQETVKRMSDFRQNLAFGAIQLFNRAGKVLLIPVSNAPTPHPNLTLSTPSFLLIDAKRSYEAHVPQCV